MIYKMIIAGFILILIVSNLKRTVKYYSVCPNNLKSLFVIWNILINSVFIFLVGFFITSKIYFIYAFTMVFPILGLFWVIFPRQFSEIQRILSGKLQTDPEFLKTTSTITNVVPVLKTVDPNQTMNYFNTPKFIRLMGILFIISGVIFLIITTKSFH